MTLLEEQLGAALRAIRVAGRDGIGWLELRQAIGCGRNKTDLLGTALEAGSLVVIRGGRLYGRPPSRDAPGAWRRAMLKAEKLLREEHRRKRALSARRLAVGEAARAEDDEEQPMRPTPIPDDEVPDGYRRIVMTAPDGDLTGEIRPAEALVHAPGGGEQRIFSFRIVLEDGDLARLAAGEPFWLSFWGGVPPFDVGLR